MTSTTMNDYATKQDITDLKHEMQLSELRISKQVTVEIKDTLWKLIPIMFGLMALVNGVFFIAYKMG